LHARRGTRLACGMRIAGALARGVGLGDMTEWA